MASPGVDEDGMEDQSMGIQTEDSRSWGSGNGYKVAQLIK